MYTRRSEEKRLDRSLVITECKCSLLSTFKRSRIEACVLYPRPKYVQLCDTKLHNYRESDQHKREAWMEVKRVVMDKERGKRNNTEL